MAYPTVPNTFVESATAYATAVNSNFSAILAGISDGTKDLNINDITVNGSFSPVNQMRTKDIQPAVDLTYNLGSAAARWNQVYINSASVASSMTVGALNVTNTATVNGNLVVATAASVNVGSTANFSNVLPVAHNAYDFGAVAKQWANIHGAYIQPGLKVTFSSGVGFRYNGTLNYLYYDATQHGFNGILQANDAFQCVGTATLLGNLSLYNVVTFVAGSAASWSAIPTMLRHEIEGFGSGANQTVSFATGTLTSGAIVNVKYVAPGYHAVIQSDGPDVVLNVKKKFSTYLKGDDQSWRPLTPPPCSFVSDASGTSEAVVQFNDLLAAMRTMGMMLPS